MSKNDSLLDLGFIAFALVMVLILGTLTIFPVEALFPAAAHKRFENELLRVILDFKSGAAATQSRAPFLGYTNQVLLQTVKHKNLDSITLETSEGSIKIKGGGTIKLEPYNIEQMGDSYIFTIEKIGGNTCNSLKSNIKSFSVFFIVNNEKDGRCESENTLKIIGT